MILLKKIKERVEKELRELTSAIFVNAETAKKRISICEDCPTKKFRYLSRQCRICNCFMDVKTKIKELPLTGTIIECPEKHWS